VVESENVSARRYIKKMLYWATLPMVHYRQNLQWRACGLLGHWALPFKDQLVAS
jgi:hypothetical protein